MNTSFRCAAIAHRLSSRRGHGHGAAGRACTVGLAPHPQGRCALRLRLSLPLSLSLPATHHFLLFMSSCRHDPQKEWPQPSTRGRRSLEIDELAAAAVANGSMQREQLCASHSAGGAAVEAEGEGAGEAMLMLLQCAAEVEWRLSSSPNRSRLVDGRMAKRSDRAGHSFFVFFFCSFFQFRLRLRSAILALQPQRLDRAFGHHTAHAHTRYHADCGCGCPRRQISVMLGKISKKWLWKVYFDSITRREKG